MGGKEFYKNNVSKIKSTIYDFGKRIVISILILAMMLSNSEILLLNAFADDTTSSGESSVTAMVNSEITFKQNNVEVTAADPKEAVTMDIHLEVSAAVDTDNASIRIDLSDGDFKFTDFSTNSDGASYNCVVNEATGQVYNAVYHIDSTTGEKYITIDNLTPGSTFDLFLNGYFNDDVTNGDKLVVSVNGEEKASINVENVQNTISVTNSKTASKSSISYHNGDTASLQSDLNIDYHIGATVTIPDKWTGKESVNTLTITDTMNFPNNLYIDSTDLDLSKYITLGTNSALTISDFTPVYSSDGTKVVGVKVNKTLTDSSAISSYLSDGADINFKYNDGMVVSEGDGTITNDVQTTYTTPSGLTGTANKVSANTSIDETTGATFSNISKALSSVSSKTGNGGNGWFYNAIVEGDTVTYTISATNSGDEAGDIDLTDILPAGTSLVSATGTYLASNSPTEKTVTVGDTDSTAEVLSLKNVPAYTTATVTLTLEIADENAFTYDSNGQAKFKNSIYTDDLTTPIATASTEVVVQKKTPDLDITKTVKNSNGNDYAEVGDTLTYTIVVQNKGTKDTTTEIVDALPSSLEYVSSEISCYDSSTNTTTTSTTDATVDTTTNTLTWSNIDAPANSTKKYTITVTATVKEGTTGAIDNIAYVDKDLDTEESAKATMSIFDEDDAFEDTKIEKTVDKSRASKGDTITYQIKITNDGLKYYLSDITGQKISVTDTIPEGVSYTGGAYYVLPDSTTQLTDNVSYDDTTNVLSWDLTSDIFDEFKNGKVVTLYIPCTVTAEGETEDKTITNTVESSTLDKNSSYSFTVPSAAGLKVEKFVREIKDASGNTIYENKTDSNKDPITVDVEENYSIVYDVKITNSSSSDVTLDKTNGVFTDTKSQLVDPDNNSSIPITVYNSDRTVATPITATNSWEQVYNPYNAACYGDTWNSLSAADFTVKANDYILLEYTLNTKSIGFSKATNTVTNDQIGTSAAQEVINQSEVTKSAAIVSKSDVNTKIGSGAYTFLSYLDGLTFYDESKVAANALDGKCLLYKITFEPTSDMADTFTLSDTLGEHLNWVTDLTNHLGGNNYTTGNGSGGYGPVVAAVINSQSQWNSWRSIQEYDSAFSISYAIDSTDAKTLNSTFTYTGSADKITYEIYYLVSVDEDYLDTMVDKSNNEIDFDAVDLINNVGIVSNKTDTDGNPLIDVSDSTTTTVNNGTVYAGIEKNYLGFYGNGEDKVDSDGNAQLSTGNANAGANLVWKVTVYNDEGDGAKTMKNYTVTDTLPAAYRFSAKYLDSTYEGAKYSPSIVIYNKDGSVKKTIKGSDFILPDGYDSGNVLTWNFDGEDYYLEPGEKMEIIYAAEVANVARFGAFMNKADVTVPTKINKENVDKGTVVGKHTIEDISYVNIYAYSTTSHKEIEYDPDAYSVLHPGETADYEQPEKDTGTSVKEDDGTLDNKVEGKQGELVKYTLYMQNSSTVNIKDLTFIDRMPYVGDIGVVTDYSRSSSFAVKYNSFISADIYAIEDGKEVLDRHIDSSKINITFSDNKTANFTASSKDWKGENDVADWYSGLLDTSVNVRFLIEYDENDDQTYLKPGEYIRLTFYGELPEYISTTGENEVAWNNFGYGYTAYNQYTGSDLSGYSVAEPAKVGVWVDKEEVEDAGTIIVKKTYNNSSLTAESEVFYFVLYRYNEDYDETDATSQEYIKYGDIFSLEVDPNTTDSTTLENLPAGKYKVYETDIYGNILDATKNEYYIITNQGASVELEADETEEIEFINTALDEVSGSIEIDKYAYDSNGDSVTGGTYNFVLINENGKYITEDGKELSEFSSSAIISVTVGKAKVISGLPIGEYKVREVNSSGEKVNTDTTLKYTVDIDEDIVEITREDPDQKLTFNNTLKYSLSDTRDITVTKVWSDEDNSKNIRPTSVEVELYKNKVATGTVQTITEDSSKNWEATFTGLQKYDADGNEIKYTVVETAVDNYTAKVTGNMEDGFTVTNTLNEGTLDIYKTNGTSAIAGTEFEIYGPFTSTEIDTSLLDSAITDKDEDAFDGYCLDEKKIDKAIIDDVETESPYITDSTGHITFKALPGYYIIKETTAASGYSIGFGYTYMLVEQDKTNTKEIVNSLAKAKIQINKVDIEGNSLRGATISIIKVDGTADGTVVETFTTDGTIHEVEVDIGYEYVIHEDTAPEGYLCSVDIYVAADEDGQVIEVGIVDEYDNISVTGINIEKNWVNGDFIVKPDEITATIVGSEGTEDDVIISADKGWKGTFAVQKYVGGVEQTFTVTEKTVVPDCTSSVEYDEDTDTYIITNTSNIGELVIVKQDADKNELSGAKLKVYGPFTSTEVDTSDLDTAKTAKDSSVYETYIKNGLIVEEFTTDESARISRLESGIYIIEEADAPDGYEIDFPYTYAIVKAGEDTQVTIVNEKAKADITVRKVDAAEFKELSGAVLVLYKTDSYSTDSLVIRFNTDSSNSKVEIGAEYPDVTITYYSDGACLITNLEDGEYRLHEDAAPDGYMFAEDITFTIEDGIVSTDGKINEYGQIVMQDARIAAVTDNIDISKVVKFADSSVYTGSDETFTFKIEADNSSYPMPEDSKITIKGNGTASFENIEFDEAGTYSYTITEVAGTNSNCTYSNQVYTVTYTVELDDGKYVIVEKAITLKEGTTSKTATDIVFTNEVKNTKITVNKDVAGNKGDTTRDFTFTFTIDSADSFAITKVDAAGNETISTIKSGDTFTLKDGEHVDISIKSGLTYKIEEESTDYTTTINGTETTSYTNKATFTDETLNVVNTLDGAPLVGVADSNMEKSVGLMIVIASLGFVLMMFNKKAKISEKKRYISKH